MKTTCKLYKYALALLLAVMGGMSAWGQAVTGDRYSKQYESGWNWFNTSDQTIQHKSAKWHSERTGGNFVDTFDDTKFFTYGSQTDIQATHTTVDTIYVKKGTSIVLSLPDRRGGFDESGCATNIGSYQRWYNFRTGKTFELVQSGFYQQVFVLLNHNRRIKFSIKFI